MTKKKQPDILAGLKPKINAALSKAQQYSDKAVEFRISAGKLLLEAKEEVAYRRDHGEKITWKGWVEENCNRSYSDCNKCIRLVNAPDPQKALEDDRRKAREGMASKRKKDQEKISAPAPSLPAPTPAKPLTELDKLRQEVVAWVQNTATEAELNNIKVMLINPAKDQTLDPKPEPAKPEVKTEPKKAESQKKKEPAKKESKTKTPAESLKKAAAKTKTAKKAVKEKIEKEDFTPEESEEVREGYVEPADDDLTIPGFLKRG